MSLITSYLTLQAQYDKKYGPGPVVLLYEVGTFYEVYQYVPEYCTTDEAKIDADGVVWDENIGHAIEVSTVLNCLLTFQDKEAPYGIKSPHKMGFPTIAYEKNRNTLLAHEYTVIRYDQDRANKTARGNMNRVCAEICSPTTHLEGVSVVRSTSNILTVYIEHLQPNTKKCEHHITAIGVSVVDIITGQNRVCEFYSKRDDPVYAIQELYRFIVSHYPRDIQVHITDVAPADSTAYQSYIEKTLELHRFDRSLVTINEMNPEFKKIMYQKELFNKVFSDNTNNGRMVIQRRNERIIEELGLERMDYGRIAYIMLLQYCSVHNKYIIAKLSKPDSAWIDQSKHLILAHNAIMQLNIITDGTAQSKTSRKKIDSLISVLDFNQTHLGRRALLNLLQNPMNDPKDINLYYDMVHEMSTPINDKEKLWQYLDRALQELPDIARLQRKLEIKIITPKELSVLFNSYIKVIGIYITIVQCHVPHIHSQAFTPSTSAEFNEFITRFSTIIDFAALECSYIDSSEAGTKLIEFDSNFIRPGFYSDIDQHCATLTQAETHLQQIVDYLNGFLVKTTGRKLEYKNAKKKPGAKKQDPTATVLTTTIAKANVLEHSAVDSNFCGALQIHPYTASEKIITSPVINSLIATIDQTKMQLRYQLYTVYQSIVDTMVGSYRFYTHITDLIAKLDLVHSYAKAAHLYKYTRPVIDATRENSFVEAKAIRHPIIERVIDGEYVPNDVTMDENGILLFGINMAGKSSLAKAIALVTVMAQAGCYTPCQMKYKPYDRIITRLSGADDIIKGDSSFAVEISELRTIVRQADGKTLVVGDELCRGTETYSGMAITGTTIEWLIKAKSSFIFATHMHDILSLPSIRAIPENQLSIRHLSVYYNESTQDLVYDRKLEPGPGESIYGILVAKALKLPTEFIERSYQYLTEITKDTPHIVNPTPSRYNSQVYVDECAICHRTRGQTELNTHHIKHQSEADAVGLIGTTNKNVKDNLMILCRDCHTNLHKKGTDIVTHTVPTGKIIILK
jgi:DNA mismatch repair protein MutS